MLLRLYSEELSRLYYVLLKRQYSRIFLLKRQYSRMPLERGTDTTASS